MRKALAIGALAVIAMLILLLHELHAPLDATPASASVKPAAVPAAVVTSATPAAKVAPAPALAPADDGKVNINSDDFFDRYVERSPKVVSRAAMSCYRGGASMDQWVTISFVGHVKNGEVTFTDAKAKDSHLDDKVLEDCMIDAVAHAHFHDDTLPDVEQYADTTTLNPERGGKKYMPKNEDDATPAPPGTPR